MKILVTGGTVFASRFVAEYFSKHGEKVFVLNRGTKSQPDGCSLIKADRHFLGDILRGKEFDVIFDVTAYTKDDIFDLLDSGVKFNDYILVSSSAVYPETNIQPFLESQTVGRNMFWGDYGINKIQAEKALRELVPNAYIVRPPYLYGQGNNIYREAFVFDCAEQNRKFYLPRDGKMKLQFFHIHDLCQVFEAILEEKPKNHILNVGNENAVTIKEWVRLCYKVCGKIAEFVEVHSDIPQKNYFPFYDYEYFLDVKKQKKILANFTGLTDLEIGLRESYEWYAKNKDCVNRKNLIEFLQLLKFDEKLQNI